MQPLGVVAVELFVLQFDRALHSLFLMVDFYNSVKHLKEKKKQFM